MTAGMTTPAHDSCSESEETNCPPAWDLTRTRDLHWGFHSWYYYMCLNRAEVKAVMCAISVHAAPALTFNPAVAQGSIEQVPDKEL